MNKWYQFPETQEAIVELIERADSGDAVSQSKLSLMYFNGYAVDRDLGEAFKYLELASKDIYSVTMCYKTAAQKYNDPGAYYGLYVMSEYGWGVGVNQSIASKNLKKSAELGFSQAKYILGLNHKSNSYGVKQDLALAEKWLLEAAQEGVRGANTALYHLYKSGPPQFVNLQKAFDCIFKAAQDGYANDQLLLGEMFQNGYGVEPHQIEAAKWYYLAACQNESPDAAGQKQWDEITRIVSEQQLETAKAKANNWINDHGNKAEYFLGLKTAPEDKYKSDTKS